MRTSLPWRAALTALVWTLTAAAASAQLPPTGTEIRLWEGPAPLAAGDGPEDTPALTVYQPAPGTASGASVVVLPGGGYRGRARHEGEPIARWLASHGVTAFVARYRVHPYRHPAPLTDAQRAIRMVRARAEAWGLDPTRIGILGFSAGGHLASTAATLFTPGDPSASDPVERVSSRPDVAILIYPVITFVGDGVHVGSRTNLLGPDATPEQMAALSSERNVTADTPPTFLVHTTGDTAVPPENSLAFVEAMRRHGVPVELHLFEGGRHGFGLGETEGPYGRWPALAALWLERRGFTTRAYDVVVYGGTAGGVVTAIAAAREGRRVALLEPRDHLGGMVSGGLGWTDYGKKEVIGGYALEFYRRAGRKYGTDVQWHLEPHVAEEIFHEWVAEAGVDVFFRHRLRERTGVVKDGTRVTAVHLENGAEFRARVFVDASYEGDLMAQAGVTYTFGRESSAQYGESLAGVRDRTPLHQFEVPVDPYDADGRLLPEITDWTKEPPGTADRKIQAYNFRVCMTQVPGNRVPFPKPAGYDPARFALLARMLAAMDAHKRAVAARAAADPSRGPDPKRRLDQPWSLRDVMKPDPIPNGKTDTNNYGAFSTDYIGGNYDYPDGDYATRERIWQEHTRYVQGFFYFLQNDPQVPEALREAMAPWGLCKDEFVDTGNWPHQLYVREARRLVGEYVMTQRDIQTDLAKPDVIGMGSYNSDSHNIQRFVNADGYAENEGDMQVPVTPYQIPYRMLLPRRAEATNLLVAVPFSASHVAYSTLRMEPQYMIIGQAAGVAAAMAVAADVDVHAIDVPALVETLRGQGAVLSYTPAQAAAVPPGAPQDGAPQTGPAAVRQGASAIRHE
jgi:acetyl esterase/lipase